MKAADEIETRIASYPVYFPTPERDTYTHEIPRPPRSSLQSVEPRQGKLKLPRPR